MIDKHLNTFLLLSLYIYILLGYARVGYFLRWQAEPESSDVLTASEARNPSCLERPSAQPAASKALRSYIHLRGLQVEAVKP